ncbi:hypothetical protein [Streptococcus pluranimalium]|uniref:hypothetical protein n=1 Tax=Streptococcus pluranimalium TaxID=82348 RepID=UPI002B08A9F7|nr:hypothetical protein [Streptococcus suis]
MSKTVSELAQELGLSKQYINRILAQNNLGRKKGNKKVVSGIDEKKLISILEGNVRNKKSETDFIVSDESSIASDKWERRNVGNKKTETEIENSFQYIREQLEIKGKEVEQLHQLLDQSQQLLLNEQKKNQLLLESKNDEFDGWIKEKESFQDRVNRLASDNDYYIRRYYENKSSLKSYKLALLTVSIILVLLVIMYFFFLI